MNELQYILSKISKAHEILNINIISTPLTILCVKLPKIMEQIKDWNLKNKAMNIDYKLTLIALNNGEKYEDIQKAKNMK